MYRSMAQQVGDVRSSSTPQGVLDLFVFRFCFLPIFNFSLCQLFVADPVFPMGGGCAPTTGNKVLHPVFAPCTTAFQLTSVQ